MSHASASDLAKLGALCFALGCASSSSGGEIDASSEAGARDGAKDDTGTTCDIPECLRPYNCRLSCSGPVVSSSCCACALPSFDDFCCRMDACP